MAARNAALLLPIVNRKCVQEIRKDCGVAQEADVLLDEMVKAIVDEVDPEQVILFGSRARAVTRRRTPILIW